MLEPGTGPYDTKLIAVFDESQASDIFRYTSVPRRTSLFPVRGTGAVRPAEQGGVHFTVPVALARCIPCHDQLRYGQSTACTMDLGEISGDRYFTLYSE